MRKSIFVRMPEILSGAAIRAEPPNTFYFPLHQHETNSELLLITEGKGNFLVGGQHYEAKAGSLMIYNRGVWHEERSTSVKFSAIYVAYTGLQLKGLPPDYLTASAQPAMLSLSGQFVPIKKLFGEMIAEWHSPLPESAAISNGLLSVLMGRLARMLHDTKEETGKKRPNKEAVHLARRFIEENYHSDVNLESLAKLTYMNPYHFIHVFKEETGISPIQYVIRYRIEVAKRYLETTRLPMADIAEKVGYQSETYFQNLFKKITGVSPGRYRLSSQDEDA